MFTNKAHANWIKYVLFSEEKCSVIGADEVESELYYAHIGCDEYSIRIVGDTAKVANLYDYPKKLDLDYSREEVIDFTEKYGATHKWEKELENYKKAGGSLND